MVAFCTYRPPVPTITYRVWQLTFTGPITTRCSRLYLSLAAVSGVVLDLQTTTGLSSTRKITSMYVDFPLSAIHHCNLPRGRCCGHFAFLVWVRRNDLANKRSCFGCSWVQPRLLAETIYNTRGIGSSMLLCYQNPLISVYSTEPAFSD